MSTVEYNGNWTQGYCESCEKNAGERVEMVREKICEGQFECYVCPQCGATKRL